MNSSGGKSQDQTAWLSIGEKKEIFRTHILALDSEKYRSLRTHAELDFITIRCSDWVNVIARTEKNELLLIRQFRAGTKDLEWEIPGGCMERSDFSPVEAGMRELAEETGFSGDSPRLIGQVSPNPALQGNTCYTVFLDHARQVSEPHQEDTESIVTHLVPEEEVIDMVQNGTIRHALFLNALFFYFMKIKGVTLQ